MLRTRARAATIQVSTLTNRYYISFGATRSRTEYKTFGGAVRTAKAKGYDLQTTVDPMIEYRANANKTKIVSSLCGGKLVRIPVNTPACCDPSTETYWSM